MLCAVDNFPLVLAGFPVKPGMTTDRYWFCRKMAIFTGLI